MTMTPGGQEWNKLPQLCKAALFPPSRGQESGQLCSFLPHSTVAWVSWECSGRLTGQIQVTSLRSCLYSGLGCTLSSCLRHQRTPNSSRI